MEFVLVVRRDDLFPRNYPQGMFLLEEHDDREMLARMREKAFFIERREAEGDPRLKQLIPYCLVCRPDQGELLLMERLPAQGEARLHGKLSIGVGGHINPPDEEEEEDIITAGLRRELAEEVILEGEERVQLLGLINDDSNPVGAVHFGLVFGLVLAPGGSAEIREKEAIKGGFLPLEEILTLCQNTTKFETWSAAILERTGAWRDRLL